jgi:homoserine kinase
VFERALRLEGHPDNAGPAVYGGLFLAGPRPTRLRLSPELAVALAIPDATIDTHAARARLPRDVSREVAIAQAARAAALVLGLTGGDPHLIGFGMEDQLAVPHRKDLIPGFDAAVAAGREAGAYGVTISGAGSALLAFTSLKSTAAVGEAMALALTRAGNPARPLTPKVSEEGLRRVS